jgi:hypothetical protein
MGHCHAHAIFNSIRYNLSFHGCFFNDDLSAEYTIRIPVTSVLDATPVALVHLGNDFPNPATGKLWNI